MELKKTLEVNMLINLYGNMLNQKQKFVMESYFFYDNSLSEIADELGITRQAVSDLINRVLKTLYNYEKNIKLLCKIKNTNQIINNLLKQNISENTKNEILKIKTILED